MLIKNFIYFEPLRDAESEFKFVQFFLYTLCMGLYVYTPCVFWLTSNTPHCNVNWDAALHKEILMNMEKLNNVSLMAFIVLYQL